MRGCTHTLKRVVASAIVILAAADTEARHVGFAFILAFEKWLFVGPGVERFIFVGYLANVSALDIGQFLFPRRNFIKRHEFEAASTRVEHGIVVGVKIVSTGREPRLRPTILVNGLAYRANDGIAHKIIKLAAA
jgi:hypothetical protein